MKTNTRDKVLAASELEIIYDHRSDDNRRNSAAEEYRKGDMRRSLKAWESEEPDARESRSARIEDAVEALIGDSDTTQLTTETGNNTIDYAAVKCAESVDACSGPRINPEVLYYESSRLIPAAIQADSGAAWYITNNAMQFANENDESVLQIGLGVVEAAKKIVITDKATAVFVTGIVMDVEDYVGSFAHKEADGMTLEDMLPENVKMRDVIREAIDDLSKLERTEGQDSMKPEDVETRRKFDKAIADPLKLEDEQRQAGMTPKDAKMRDMIREAIDDLSKFGGK